MSGQKPERYCGTCVHESSGFSGPMCGARYDHIEQRHSRCLVSPHSCEHWQASDAHRQALALEAIAEAALLSVGLLEPPEEIVPVPVRFRCDGCSSIVDAMSTDETAQCGTCKACYVNQGESWDLVDTDGEAH